AQYLFGKPLTLIGSAVESEPSLCGDVPARIAQSNQFGLVLAAPPHRTAFPIGNDTAVTASQHCARHSADRLGKPSPASGIARTMSLGAKIRLSPPDHRAWVMGVKSQHAAFVPTGGDHESADHTGAATSRGDLQPEWCRARCLARLPASAPERRAESRAQAIREALYPRLSASARCPHALGQERWARRRGNIAFL